MTSDLDQTSPRAATRLLNRLIVACSDGRDAHDAAARVVRGGPRRERLEDGARRRASFVHELSEMVRASGGSPATGGSAVEAVRSALNRVRALVVGGNTGDAYAVCTRVEAKAERLYEDAVERGLPGSVQDVISRHYAEIVADHDELRRLRGGGDHR